MMPLLGISKYMHVPWQKQSMKYNLSINLWLFFQTKQLVDYAKQNSDTDAPNVEAI